MASSFSTENIDKAKMTQRRKQTREEALATNASGLIPSPRQSAAYPSNMGAADTTGFYRPSSTAGPVTPPSPVQPTVAQVRDSAQQAAPNNVAPSGVMAPGEIDPRERAQRLEQLRHEHFQTLRQLQQLGPSQGHELNSPTEVTRTMLIAQRHALEAQMQPLQLATAPIQRVMSPQEQIDAHNRIRAQYDVAAKAGYGSPVEQPPPKGPADFARERQLRELGLNPNEATDRLKFKEFSQLSGRPDTPPGWAAPTLPLAVGHAQPNPFSGPANVTNDQARYDQQVSNRNFYAAQADKNIRAEKNAEQYKMDEQANLRRLQGAQIDAATKDAVARGNVADVAGRPDLALAERQAQIDNVKRQGELVALDFEKKKIGASREVAADAVNTPEVQGAVNGIVGLANAINGGRLPLSGSEASKISGMAEQHVNTLLDAYNNATDPYQKSQLKDAITTLYSQIRTTPGWITSIGTAGGGVGPAIVGGLVGGPVGAVVGARGTPETARFYAALQKLGSIAATR